MYEVMEAFFKFIWSIGVALATGMFIYGPFGFAATLWCRGTRACREIVNFSIWMCFLPITIPKWMLQNVRSLVARVVLFYMQLVFRTTERIISFYGWLFALPIAVARQLESFCLFVPYTVCLLCQRLLERVI